MQRSEAFRDDGIRERRHGLASATDMRVSVVIKALNEQRHIARAIESALGAIGVAAPGRGEVILADSRSSDRTVEIAQDYPIRIARLADTAPRSCGTGPQLGFQYARGAFVCLIDGDMALDASFLAAGIAFLENHPDVAGVGGRVHDVNIVNLEFERRNRRGAADLRPGPVDRLNGGGLYRRDAIDAVGYFSDRNLHGYEEFELAVRLRGAGWSLHRLAIPFVDHHGHVTGGYALLWRRIRTRYLDGIGELLRGALGQPHLGATLRDLPEIGLWLAILVAWVGALCALALMPLAPVLAALAALCLLALVAMSLRYRSLALGLYAVVAWNAHAFGMVRGVLKRRVAPDAWIDSTLTAVGRKQTRPLPEAARPARPPTPGDLRPLPIGLSEPSASLRGVHGV